MILFVSCLFLNMISCDRLRWHKAMIVGLFWPCIGSLLAMYWVSFVTDWAGTRLGAGKLRISASFVCNSGKISGSLFHAGNYQLSFVSMVLIVLYLIERKCQWQ